MLAILLLVASLTEFKLCDRPVDGQTLVWDTSRACWQPVTPKKEENALGWSKVTGDVLHHQDGGEPDVTSALARRPLAWTPTQIEGCISSDWLGAPKVWSPWYKVDEQRESASTLDRKTIYYLHLDRTLDVEMTRLFFDVSSTGDADQRAMAVLTRQAIVMVDCILSRHSTDAQEHALVLKMVEGRFHQKRSWVEGGVRWSWEWLPDVKAKKDIVTFRGVAEN